MIEPNDTLITAVDTGIHPNVDTGIDPNDGVFYSQLSTSSVNSNDDLEAFLGVSSTAIDSITNGDPTNGSAIKTTLALDAGDIIQFDWAFSTTDIDPFIDNSFFLTLNGGLQQLADVGTVGDLGDSGWHTESFTVTTAGVYDIGFGVVNVEDSSADSVLSIDNIDIIDTPTSTNLDFESGDFTGWQTIGNASVVSSGAPTNTFFTDASIGDNPNIDDGLDVDLYQVQLQAGDQIFIDIDTINQGGGIDSFLRLFDAGGNQLSTNDDQPAPGEDFTLDSFIDFTVDETGSYFIGVSDLSNTNYDPTIEGSGDFGGSTGDYSLELTVTSPVNLFGGAGDDVLVGSPGKDLITALAGNDVVQGFGGDDTLSGGSDDDIILAGSGNDSVTAGNGNDVVFGDDGSDNVSGDSGDDRIFGGGGNDSLSGSGGNDIVFGEGGSDTLRGNNGSDILNGGDGSDLLIGDSGDDQLTGVNISSGFGQSEIDTLTGGDGSDTFILGDKDRIYYDDTDQSTGGESDFALVTDFDSALDFIQLNGSAEQYQFDFFSSGGATSAVLIFDPSDLVRVEVIGILENVSTDLNLTDPAFIFV